MRVELTDRAVATTSHAHSAVTDSHGDSHGGTTPSHRVDLMDGTHERSGRQTPLYDATDAEHADF